MRIYKKIVGWLCILSLLTGVFFTLALIYHAAKPYIFGASMYRAYRPKMAEISRLVAMDGLSRSDGAILRKYATTPLGGEGYPVGMVDAILTSILQGSLESTEKAFPASVLMDRSGRIVAAYPEALTGRRLPVDLVANRLSSTPPGEGDPYGNSFQGYGNSAWDASFRALADNYSLGRGESYVSAVYGPDGKIDGYLAIWHNNSVNHLPDPRVADYQPPHWVYGLTVYVGDEQVQLPIVPMIAFPLFLFLIPVWVGLDAAWRGMRPFAWGLLVVLTGIIGIAAYFIARLPGPRGCPNCGEEILSKYSRCPSCGITLLARCPVCHAKMKPGWQFCPRCNGVPPSPQEEASGYVPAELQIRPEMQQTHRKAAHSQSGVLQVCVTDEASGTPVANVKVALGGPVTIDGLTNSRGRFEVGRLRSGKYTVSVVKTGYEPVNREVEIKETSCETLVLTLRALPGRVAGRIVDQHDGRPLRGARVYVDSTRVDVSAVSGEEGGYTLEGVPAGPFMVRVDAEEYEPQTKLADVRPGQQFPLDFELQAYPEILLAGDAVLKENSNGNE